MLRSAPIVSIDRSLAMKNSRSFSEGVSTENAAGASVFTAKTLTPPPHERSN
jgi:hypothetical protein